jgi:molecular chaperone GrpE
MNEKNKEKEEKPVGKTEAVEQKAPARADSADALKGELEALKTNYMRALADLENQKKRHAREKEEFLRYGNSSLVSAILPIVDNFERALKAAEEHHPEARSLLEGLGMIIPQLDQVLKLHGVEAITPKVGEGFDPNLHQSVGEAPSAEVPHHAVLSCQRSGYRIADRLLRPAMVMLSSGAEKK